MFEKIILANFQKHQTLELKFSKGITTLVGDTNAGKSAIMRALGWVNLNRWSSGYIKHGKKFTLAKLFVDGNRIVRKRGKGENLYKLNNKKFVAFGQGKVPPEIESVLNVCPDNFLRQLDPHFWFADSSGTISKKLNKIVNLEDIDKSLGFISKLKNKNKSQIQISHDRLQEIKLKYKELKWTTEADKELNKLEELKEELDKLNQSTKMIDDLVTKVDKLKNEASSGNSEYEISKELLEDAERVLSYEASYNKVNKKVQVLSNLIKTTTELKNKLSVEIPNTDKLDKARSDADKISEECGLLESTIDEIEFKEDVLWNEKENLKIAEKEFQEKTKEMTCPTCGKLLKKQELLNLPASPPTYTSGTRHR